MITTNNTEDTPLKTLDDALAFMAQTFTIVERYRYDRERSFTVKERDQMNALIALTKITLQNMFYAAFEMGAHDKSGSRR